VFNNQSIYALVVGGVSMMLAGLLNFLVKDNSKDSAEDTIDDIAKSQKTPASYI
jgi:hypothetical protein